MADLTDHFRSQLEQSRKESALLSSLLHRTRLATWLWRRVLRRRFAPTPEGLRWWCLYAKIIGEQALAQETVHGGPPRHGLAADKAWSVLLGLARRKLGIDDGVNALVELFGAFEEAEGSKRDVLELGDCPKYVLSLFWLELCENAAPPVAKERHRELTQEIETRCTESDSPDTTGPASLGPTAGNGGFSGTVPKQGAPGGDGGEAPPEKGSEQVKGGGVISCAELSDREGVPSEALRKALERFRKASDQGWIEVSDRRHREPKYLYDPEATLSVVQKLRGRVQLRK